MYLVPLPEGVDDEPPVTGLTRVEFAENVGPAETVEGLLVEPVPKRVDVAFALTDGNDETVDEIVLFVIGAE